MSNTPHVGLHMDDPIPNHLRALIPSEVNWDLAKQKCERVHTSAASRDFGRITWRCQWCQRCEVKPHIAWHFTWRYLELGYTLSIPVVKELRSHGNPHFMEGQLELRFGCSWSYNSDFPNHMVAIGLPSPDKGNAFFLLLKTIYTIRSISRYREFAIW